LQRTITWDSRGTSFAATRPTGTNELKVVTVISKGISKDNSSIEVEDLAALLAKESGDPKAIEKARKWVGKGLKNKEGIKALRLSRGMSQADLARASGMQQPHISAIECGKRRPDYDNAFNIATALQITVADFYKAFKKSKGSI
jgi:DNA-binding XRE family transcriptional regulator